MTLIKRIIIVLAVVMPLAALAVIAGLALSPATRARADAAPATMRVATPAAPHHTAPSPTPRHTEDQP